MAMAAPTVVTRKLGRELRDAREKAEITVEQVAQEGICSETTVWRIESGKTPVKKVLLWALCRFYGVDDEKAAALELLAANADKQGWWEEYVKAKLVPQWFQLFASLEASATSIETWEDGVVPGELQTADYATAVYQAGLPGDSNEAIEQLVKSRLDRQDALFNQPLPPRLSIVMGEGVLRRPVGGPDVMAAQIARLRELDQLEHVEIRWLPFAAGAHAAMTGAFRVLTFKDDKDPDVVYLESHSGAVYLEKEAQLAEYRKIFELIRKQAAPIGEYLP